MCSRAYNLLQLWVRILIVTLSNTRLMTFWPVVTPTYYVTCEYRYFILALHANRSSVTFCTLVTSVVRTLPLHVRHTCVLIRMLDSVQRSQGLWVANRDRGACILRYLYWDIYPPNVQGRSKETYSGTCGNRYNARTVCPSDKQQVDEHTALLLEAARSEIDPLAVRRASVRRSATLRSRRSRHSNVRSQISSDRAPSDVFGAAPQVSLPGHITGEDSLEDFDLDFDDLASTQEIVQRTEAPGMDSLRGTFGAIGTIIRAKRRARALSAASHARAELSGHVVHGQSSNSRSEEGARSMARSGSGTSGHRPSWLPHGAWNTPG